jgi:hypothetical protein
MINLAMKQHDDSGATASVYLSYAARPELVTQMAAPPFLRITRGR